EAPRREVTVRDLMRHTSGLIYGNMALTPVGQLYHKHRVMGPGTGLKDLVESLGKVPLADQPGSRFNYGVSVDVLARLVEVISKKGLDQFFEEAIFKPLDMKDTGFFVPAE